jgi:molybdopterin-guanine dinucleotide biosynthesis protein A
VNDGTAIAVLAGGRSRRMGRPKALLPLGGSTLLQPLLASLEPLGHPVTLIAPHADVDADDLADALARFGLPVTRDATPDAGPLAGLDAAFASTGAQRLLLLACDLPFLTTEFLCWLVAQARPGRGALPVDAEGRLQPLCAVYDAACRPELSRRLQEGRLRMTEFAEGCGSRPLAYETWSRFDDGWLLRNVNEPADWEAARQRWDERNPGGS